MILEKIRHNIINDTDVDLPNLASETRIANNINLNNNFIIVLKPEITSNISNFAIKEILKKIDEIFSSFNVFISNCRIISSNILIKNEIIKKLYGPLNQVSHLGDHKLWTNAKKKIEQFRDKSIILGGHEFLAQNPCISSTSLDLLVNNTKVTKLGHGCYGSIINFMGSKYLILNGFHPYQYEHLTQKDSKIVCLDCYSNTPWNILREEMVGFIEPSTAKYNSIRSFLYFNQNHLKLPSICIEHNGVHISSGPLEAVSQLDTVFGSGVYKNATKSKIFEVCQENKLRISYKNCLFSIENIIINAFEETENICTTESIKLIEELKGQQNITSLQDYV